ncbi:hypothetical protein [Streptomyces rishiriensis]|uniref:hypothetical protein n=1 Tax=Streptomyces rishiriensis TaxID=68264 RepID=UPI0037D8C077
MRSPTRARGRRGVVWGASAAAAVVVGAAGLAVDCGGGGHGGDYVAIGAAGDPAASGADGSAGPTGGVRLVPLDGPSDSPGGEPGPGGQAKSGTGATAVTETRDRTPGPAPASGSRQAPARGAPVEGGPVGRTPQASPTPPSPPSSPSPSPSAPSSTSSGPPGGASAGPASLAVSEPFRAKTDQRWCEDVTLTFVNSGGTAVGSGTITFGSHVVDALGTDWATRESTAPLPVPIAAGTRKERTWTVCVDAWRVPLGMHIETRDVSVRWE